MHKIGLYAFITMMLFVAACMMLAAGSHPGMIVLVLGGMALLAFRVNTIIDRGRTRRGRPRDFTMSFMDISELKASDLIELMVTILVSLAMFAIGILVFGSQALIGCQRGTKALGSDFRDIWPGARSR